MIRNRTLRRFAAFFLAFGTSPVFGGFVVTGISVLPLTPGGVSNQARGINNPGLVTGFENDAAGFQRGIVQQGVGPSSSIGLAPYSPPMTSSEGHAVNDNGVVVGVGRYSAPPPGSATGSVPYDRGIVFDTNTNQYQAVLEPFNSSGGRRAFAQSINDQNRVVGNGSSDPVLTNQNPRQAFWYDVNPVGSMTAYKLDPAVNGLPFLPGGNWSVAYDINDSQSIAGFSQTPDANGSNRNRAVVWDAGVPDSSGNPYTTVTRIDARNTAGTSSLARSINDDGTVVGRMTLSTAFGDETAFVHRPGDASITSLGFFGTTRTEAIDINGDGWIVGYAGATEGDSSLNNRAIVWVPNSEGIGGYRSIDLFAFLPGSAISTGGSVGWTKLLEARAINDFGTIVGYGRFIASAGGPEVTRGFVIATVPEPSGFLPGLLGTSVLAGFRLRSTRAVRKKPIRGAAGMTSSRMSHQGRSANLLPDVRCVRADQVRRSFAPSERFVQVRFPTSIRSPGVSSAMNRLQTALTLACLTLSPAACHGGFLFDIQAVPTLPGGNQNFALDINGSGQVVGNSRKNGGTSLHPYVWKVGDAAPTEIGILPGVPTFGRGFGVNDSGVVVGESGNGPSKAFRYENGTLSDFGSLPGGSGGVANDINNAGRVVGAASNGQSVRAFYTDGGGVLMDLGTPLGTSDSLARAYAINENGTIAGVARNATNTASEPALWTFDGGGAPLATSVSSPLPGAFGEFLSLNEMGFAVGRYTDANNRTRPFAFDGSTSFDLGLLPSEPTFVHGRAIDVNDSGLIVGYVARFDTAPSFGGAAVMWHNGSIFDLNTLISPGSGWRLLSAEGINEHGQIVGFGTFGGQNRAFALTPVPEPASIVALGSGLMLLGVFRRIRTGRKSEPADRS